MSIKSFLKKKDIEISGKRYLIDAMSAMAQGLFCTLLIGTILNTLGTQFKIGFLTETIVTIASTPYTIGGLAQAMVGPAMAVPSPFMSCQYSLPKRERPSARKPKWTYS